MVRCGGGTVNNIDVARWLQENQKLLHKAVAPYAGRGMPYEDLMQEAYIAALLAIRRYDESRRWALNSWVYSEVQGYLRNAIKKNNRIQHHEYSYGLNCSSDSEKNILWHHRYACSAEDVMMCRAFIDHLFSFVESNFSKQGKEDFYALIANENIKFSAQKQNVTTRTINRRRKKIRDALADHFSGWMMAL